MYTDRKALTLAAILAAGTTAPLASGETATEGKRLHDDHCLRCHDTSVYTREQRMIRTAAELEAQVERCAAGPAAVDWSREQIRSVAGYLGETFYGF